MDNTGTMSETPPPSAGDTPHHLTSGYWQDLTTTDFARIDPGRTIALLPVSACEQHGPHLPLSTDATINAGIVSAMLSDLSPRTCVLVLPAQTIGDSIEHQGFAGTLSLDFDVLVQSWVTIGAAVARAGIRKMVIFNTHGGQRGHVDQAAIRLRAHHRLLVARANSGQFGKPDDLFDDDERSFGLHGGAVETSMMLSLRPDLVRCDQLARFESIGQTMRADYRVLGVEKPVGFGWMAQDLNPAGVSGDARLASAQAGARLIAHLAHGLTTLCDELADAPYERFVTR